MITSINKCLKILFLTLSVGLCVSSFATSNIKEEINIFQDPNHVSIKNSGNQKVKVILLSQKQGEKAEVSFISENQDMNIQYQDLPDNAYTLFICNQSGEVIRILKITPRI